jgi:hypothetical protein
LLCPVQRTIKKRHSPFRERNNHTHHMGTNRQNFCGILFRNAQSPNPPRATWVCSSPQQESTTSSQPQIESTIWNSRYASKPTGEAYPSQPQSRKMPLHPCKFIRTWRHIHRRRSDTQGKEKSRSRDQRQDIRKGGSQTSLFCFAEFWGCCNVHLLSVKCTQRGGEPYV